MSLRAGAAVRDISPTKPMPLAGYPHVTRILTGIHDPLQAAVLYLENNGKAVLLGALDLIMLNCDVARRWRWCVAQKLSIPETHVLISCTHTHSAPVTMDYRLFAGDPAFTSPDPDYLQYCEDQLVAAAVEAQQHARAAQLGWTTAIARGVGGNRHSPDGPADPEVGVLAIRADGELLAVAMIYSMHPTVLHEASTVVSGDFPAFARRCIPARVVLYHTGPCGNQSPRFFCSRTHLGRSGATRTNPWRSRRGAIGGHPVRVRSGFERQPPRCEPAGTKLTGGGRGGGDPRATSGGAGTMENQRSGPRRGAHG